MATLRARKRQRAIIVGNERVRITSARRWIEAERGNPADYFQSFDRVKPREIVDLWVAVSGREHNRDRNLKDQEALLRRALRERGARVGEVTRYVGPRYSMTPPRQLSDAAIRAKRNGRKLVAETLDRFIRHDFYHSKDRPNFQVERTTDFEQLRDVTHEADLVTWLDPSAIPAQVRSHQRKRGQWAKGNKGGRSRKRRKHRAWKARRVRCGPVVRSLQAKGLNPRQIWLELESRGEIVAYRTVLRWAAGQ